MDTDREDTKVRSLFEYYGFTEADESRHPVITGILKQLTPERIENEISEVQAVELPAELQKWVDEYENTGGGRSPFLWRWLYRSFQTAHLPTIAEEFQSNLLEDKLLMTMFITVLNDAGDRRNKMLLRKLSKVSSSGATTYNVDTLSVQDKGTVDFVNGVWSFLRGRLERYPRYNEFRDLLCYDLRQSIEAINYSCLVNDNLFLINRTEYWAYASHKMMVMVYSMMDLMASPQFNKRELGATREIALCAQRMARIGNWVSTWEREIHEGDFTSGVFAYAVDMGVFAADDLARNDTNAVIGMIRDADIEKTLLEEWELNHVTMKKLGGKAPDFDVDDFLHALEDFITFHLMSRSHK